jgi:hypothetical protein
MDLQNIKNVNLKEINEAIKSNTPSSINFDSDQKLESKYRLIIPYALQ